MKRGVRPDMVTDQTSAHDPLHGYLPKGWSWEEYQQKAESDPQGHYSGGETLDGRSRAGDAGLP